MKGSGQIALWAGVASLVLGMVSRALVVPIYGIEAHAMVEFAQACFLLAIATSLTGSARR